MTLDMTLDTSLPVVELPVDPVTWTVTLPGVEGRVGLDEIVCRSRVWCRGLHEAVGV